MARHDRARAAKVGGAGMLAAAACVGAGTAGAQAPNAGPGAEPTSVTEVVVTAQKVEQRALDVPISLTVFDRNFFADTRTRTLEDLSKLTPDLVINESVGSSYTNVAIRGIGSDALNSGVEPSVGVFVDGVYQGRPAFLAADLYDIERIEVLRGPQGTLYGKNTDAGAINVITRAAPAAFEAEGRAYFGDYGTHELRAAVGGPIGDGVRVRLSGYRDEHDGYIRNTLPENDGDSFERHGVRGEIDADATDRVALVLRAAYDSHSASIINYGLLRSSPTLDFLAGAFGVALPTDIYGFTSTANFAPHERTTQFRTSLTATWRMTDGLTLTSISAYQRLHDDNRTDVDYIPLDLLDGGEVTAQEQLSQELRLASDPSARFSYLVGAFYYRQTQRDLGFNTVRPDLSLITEGLFPDGAQDLETSSTSVRSAAVFGQATYKVTDRLSATLGLRYDDQRNRQVRVQPQGVTLPDLGTIASSKSEGDVSGSASLRYAFARRVQGYVTVSRGFKGGGYNGFGVPSADDIGFKAEEATNYEGGVKAELFDRRLTLDATLFYTKLRDLQVSNFDGVNFIVGNAASATTKGVETDAAFAPMRGLILNAALSYDEAAYDRYSGAPCTAAQTDAAEGASCTQDLAGRPIANAPRWHGVVSGEYERPLLASRVNAFGRFDYAYLSSQYLETALADETRQKGYGLLNLRLGLRDPGRRWGVVLTAANLADTHYLRNAYDYPLFNGAYLAAPGRPRTFGVELETRF